MARKAQINRLTDVQLRAYVRQAAPAPLHDGGGLYLRKRQSAAYWYQRLTDPLTGNDQWHRLFPDDPCGYYPLKSLSDARAAAEALRTVRSTGIDPRQDRLQRARREAEAEAARLRNQAQEEQQRQIEAARRLTVRQLFSRWQATDLQPRTLADGTREGRKDGGAYVAAQFERHVFPTLGERAAIDVTRQDLMTVLDAQKAAGKLRTANVLFSDLKQMLVFAVDREIIPTNPLEGLKRRRVGGKDTERERVLSDAELRQLWAALPASRLNPRSRCALGLVLATGARAGELAGATWADTRATPTRIAELRAVAEDAATKYGVIDTKARTWHLPDTKNQREHTIHLSEFALAVLAELAELRELGPDGKPTPWVFPDRSRTQPVCVKSLGKQLADRQRPAEKRMSGRSKNTEALSLPGGAWTLHDLRRTAATIMARLGISGDVIDEALNHKIGSSVRRVYVRDRREADQARAFDALGAHLTATLQGEQSRSNVVQLERAA